MMTYYIVKFINISFFSHQRLHYSPLEIHRAYNHEYASLLLHRYITNTGEKTLVLVHLERDQDATRICMNNGLNRSTKIKIE